MYIYIYINPFIWAVVYKNYLQYMRCTPADPVFFEEEENWRTLDPVSIQTVP